jgi:sensor histidine kinase YesM
MKIDWIDKLRFYLQTMAFCLAVASIQFAFQPQIPYVLPLVYSVCIGSFTWVLIDFGRHLFASSAETGWPQGIAGVLLPLVGIVGGYVLGTLAGDNWFGWSSWGEHGRSQLPVSIMVTALAGITATYYFYSRNKSAYLETKMSEARHQASEAKLKLLETQLEPHMLFNTLANLRALISTDPQRAQVMLDDLINYLRATLDASRATLHPLQTEFDRLRDYLALMAVRMGPRLRYTLDLPPELASLQVPPLLLQPLVENSIKHGLEPRVEGGQITVQARRNGNLLTLDITDTGVGLTQTPSEGGFGLAQVRERLVTTYGPDATIKLIADDPAGTRASITFSCLAEPK